MASLFVYHSDDIQQYYKERLVWITADYPEKYYPEFFKTELINISQGVRHFITKDIKPT